MYAKNSLNVVLVSGEYKIGKTALLQEFLQKKSAAYFAARNALSTVIGYDDARFLCSSTYGLYIKYPNAYKIINVMSRMFLFLLRFFLKK